ncbi:MAG: hypothetical protein FJX46_16370 [Alphaproteobacteria bacterium]|nr:hypothetical protein [Alphaproteobacteria bacterium]
MIAALDFLARHATRVMAGSVLIGLFVPWITPWFKTVIVPALMWPMVVSFLRLETRQLVEVGRRPLAVGLLVATVLIASPLAAMAALAPFDLPAGVRDAVVLMAASAPIMSCPAIALLIGLDFALALAVSVLATALVPFTLPPIALHLLGLQLDISAAELMLRLIGLIGGSALIAWAIRRIAGPERMARNARRIDGLAVIGLAVFAFAIMDGVNAVMIERPLYILGVTVLSFVANIALQAAAIVLFLPLGPLRALTAGLVTGNCNMGLVLTALADKATLDTMVYFAMAQLPMFMLPAIQLSLYRRWSGQSP